MKKLKDYKEEIYKCSKCGLCQSVCPIFEELGIECAVSRGKFSLLNGIIEGELAYSPKISEYLDLCLNCNACTDFCPANIDAEKILTIAKYESQKAGFFNKNKLLGTKIFSYKPLLKIIGLVTFFYRFLNLSFWTGFASKMLDKKGKAVNILNNLLKKQVSFKKIKPKTTNNLTVVYFPGCINTYINPSVKNAVLTVLKANGIKIIVPDFNCCGIPARNNGNFEDFIKLAKQNLDKLDFDFDYLITDCASCGSVWDMYTEALSGHHKEKAQKISQKALNIYQLLDKIDLYIPENNEQKLTVTYHDPCHLKRFSGVSEEPRNILKKIPQIEFIEMEEADKCCGAAGTFCITNSKLSKAISAKKAQNIIKTKAQAVATSCPSCNMGLYQGLLEINEERKIIQPIEILALIYQKKSLKNFIVK